jgi:molybdate transport system substrate-binding protein
MLRDNRNVSAAEPRREDAMTRSTTRRIALAILTALPLLATAPAFAAELRVLGAGPVEGAFKDLASAFARATGHTVHGTFDTVGVIESKLKAGEKADILILSVAAIAEMEKAGTLIAGSGSEVGRAASGLAVRAGAPVPSIATPDALKATLIAARSVAYVDPAVGATNGIFFARLIEKLGIADQVNKKAVLLKRGYEVAQTVADGGAEIGNTSLTELTPHKGLTVLGPIPEPLGMVVTYVAAVTSSSPNAEPARALTAFLTTPDARTRFKAAGL